MPRFPAVVINQGSPGGSFRRLRPNIDVYMENWNVGNMGGITRREIYHSKKENKAVLHRRDQVVRGKSEVAIICCTQEETGRAMMWVS